MTRLKIEFCKRLCKLHINTADFLVLGECRRYHVAVNYILTCIEYWTKLISMPENGYPKQCYLMLRKIESTKIKVLLFEHGFGYAWIANELGDPLQFLKMFKQTLFDNSLQI